MTPNPSPQPFPAARATVIFTGVVAFLGLLAGAGLAMMHRGAWLAPVLAPALACLAGSLVSLALVALSAKQGLQKVSLVMLAGMVVRLAFVMLGASICVIGFGMDRAVVVPAAIGWYIVLLAVETRFFTHYFKSIPPVGPSPAAPVEAPSCQ